MAMTDTTEILPAAREGSRNQTTILVVGDQVRARSVAAEALTEAGLRVVKARNADEAVKVMAEVRSVDLVLTDLNSSGSNDGVALARMLRFHRPQVKVVFLSADAANEALRDWGDGFLFKPCDPAVLVKTVMNVLTVGGARAVRLHKLSWKRHLAGQQTLST
jgi:CheY-like chemotaxis protein